MSTYHFIEKLLHWEEGTIYFYENSSDYFLFHAEFPRRIHYCPHCNTPTNRIKDYRYQRVLACIIDDKPAYIRIRKRRYDCPCCGKTFYESIPGLSKYQRRTNQQQLSIIQGCTKKMTFTDFAQQYHVSVSTAVRYFDRISVAAPSTLPSVISLDEFKGNAHGHRYQVALNDPIAHRCLDILPNRNTDALIAYFLRNYSRRERCRVTHVVIDLSSIFRKVIQTVFPNAAIIGDRYHIVRLVTWALERVRKKVQKQLFQKRIYLKRNKRILAKPGITLTEEELITLERILSYSDELRRAYALKEAFYHVLRMDTQADASYMLTQWLELVKCANIAEFSNLLVSFPTWYDAIVQSIIQPYSNGYTEGLNNKIKVLKRISFGMRNFKRFRNRILWLAPGAQRKNKKSQEYIA